MNQSAMVLVYLLLPFAISGAFWVSPWVGWPAAAVLGPAWLGTIMLMRGAK